MSIYDTNVLTESFLVDSPGFSPPDSSAQCFSGGIVGLIMQSVKQSRATRFIYKGQTGRRSGG